MKTITIPLLLTLASFTSAVAVALPSENSVASASQIVWDTECGLIPTFCKQVRCKHNTCPDNCGLMLTPTCCQTGIRAITAEPVVFIYCR
ncbi:hypothetical protein Vi05172_g2264 [Venturia inaequalis]|nr:hypothetical protein Vi05172_g2264 [Venturia inaequalis]